MELVVNEWLPDYLTPGESVENRGKAISFLDRFYERGDMLYVRAGSKFERKMLRYGKQFSYDTELYKIYKLFNGMILRDSHRCRLLGDNDIQDLPELTKSLLTEKGTNFSSDTYLFEAAYMTKDRIIITTDGKLQKQMQNDSEFQVILANDFLATYYLGHREYEA